MNLDPDLRKADEQNYKDFKSAYRDYVAKFHEVTIFCARAGIDCDHESNRGSAIIDKTITYHFFSKFWKDETNGRRGMGHPSLLCYLRKKYA